MTKQIQIRSDSVRLEGELAIPPHAAGVVLFAHGSGSSRLSPRNQFVAHALQKAGVGTLLFDLLTEEEARDRENVFDIDFLAHRLSDATRCLRNHGDARGYSLGYFGASTGAAAALVAAAQDDTIGAVVSRGGRPDLAIRHLGAVRAPTLLIIGSHDFGVVELNERAYRVLRCEKSLKIVPGATHLFEEPGALEQVAELAAAWFNRHLEKPEAPDPATWRSLVFPNREVAGRLLARRLLEVECRGDRAKIALAGKTVIVVDDGIATGSSVRAALRGVRRQGPKRLILAVPVAPAESLEALQSDADEIVCLETPEDFFAVGQFYRDFRQVSDDEVKVILGREQSAEARP